MRNYLSLLLDFSHISPKNPAFTVGAAANVTSTNTLPIFMLVYAEIPKLNVPADTPTQSPMYWV
jgi:hypothetical protein